ncbi:hypothetical protein K7432_006717 [Basidiobolus ranarum]|uniref:Uncharacterized protein n=1 Tax=Basidiobolus ranarum TaxID=34480 RepID=A0ABR2W171_9FUNG
MDKKLLFVYIFGFVFVAYAHVNAQEPDFNVNEGDPIPSLTPTTVTISNPPIISSSLRGIPSQTFTKVSVNRVATQTPKEPHNAGENEGTEVKAYAPLTVLIAFIIYIGQ